MRGKKKNPRSPNHPVKLQPKQPDQKQLKKTIIKISAWLIAGIIIAVSISLYASQVAPFQKHVLTVDKTVIRMDYFLKRIRMSGDNPTLTLQQITYEQIVKILAPQYDIIASSSDIDQALKQEAADALGKEMTDASFKEWQTKRLEAIDLTVAEYREIIHANLLVQRLGQYLAADIPTKAAQIHLYSILVATQAEALPVRSRLTAGENFAAVAAELSRDSQTKSKGGEVGWIPRGVTPYDETIFQLGVGEISDPVPVDANSPAGQYLVFMVSESDLDRVIETGPLEVLRSRVLYDLILQQIPQHVQYSYTPEDEAWVNAQLAKNPKK